MKLKEIIDLAKKNTSSKSYNELAKKIKISRGGLSQIRNGGPAKDITLLNIASLAKVEPLHVIAVYNAERAKEEKSKLFWQSTGNSIAASFFVAALLLGGIETATGYLQEVDFLNATSNNISGSNFTTYTLYEVVYY